MASAFGIRIWAAAGGGYDPDTPPALLLVLALENRRKDDDENGDDDDPEGSKPLSKPALKPVHRGWCLGREAFRPKLLELMDGGPGDPHSLELRRETAEQRANWLLRIPPLPRGGSLRMAGQAPPPGRVGPLVRIGLYTRRQREQK
ncbi:MAG: hypothetical protein ACLQU3_28805 [Limisphaerales bacterium]